MMMEENVNQLIRLIEHEIEPIRFVAGRHYEAAAGAGR